MINEAYLRMLIAIHKQEPLKGNLLTLAKQTVDLRLEMILDIFKEQGVLINPNVDIQHPQMDTSTRHHRNCSISDEWLYRLFGDDIHYHAIDVSNYENAGIVHNLNDPVPNQLECKFDFIFDGSTFDHLVDIKTGLSNICRMLRPGGRVFQCNAASNYANAGYLSFSADFFYDFYTLNKFSDCKTFFSENFSPDAQNWCLYEFLYPKTKSGRVIGYNLFRKSGLYVLAFVLARKGQASTSDQVPVQLCYRDYQSHSAHYIQPLKEQELPISPIHINQTDLSFMQRVKYRMMPKPDPRSYRYVGWV